MENKEEILKKLTSGETEMQQEAIETIKAEGDLSLVPSLFDLLISGKDHRTTTELVSLLADIKDNAFRQILIDRIKNTTEATPKSLLLRICWESALDFSPYIDFFTELLLQENFIVALEASTVLENMQHIEASDRKRVLQLLKQGSRSDEKQFLIDNVSNTFSLSED